MDTRTAHIRSASVNFVADSDTVKFGVSFLADGTGTYMLELSALRKTPCELASAVAGPVKRYLRAHPNK